MKIFFDARWTQPRIHDGISRYGANLVAALAKLHPVTMIIHDKQQLAMLPKGVDYVVLNDPMSWREIFVARKLNQLGADVVFSPMQLMGVWGRRYKLIFTLHDVIYYQFRTPPGGLPPVVRLAWWLFHAAHWPQRWLLNRADLVATVSQTSKKLIQAMHLTDREVVVIPNAPSLRPITPDPAPTKDLVYMGSFMAYKNVELLLGAMPLLPDYTLHLTSRISPARQAELQKLIANPQQIIFHGGVSDDEYNQLLARCHALVSASKAEGFGLPLLEAMAQGVPTACSDLPIFHEVCGDGGTFFDPDSPQAFAAAVRSLEDAAHRQELIQKGKAQAARFSWQHSAQTLLAVAKRLSAKAE